jgi:uroporphyrinogen decarboxylase
MTMTKMTSLQRVMTAAKGQEPDRVPVFGFFNDWAWGQLYGKDSFMEYSLDPERLANVMVWGCKELGFDSAAANPDTLVTWEAIAEASGLSYPTSKWKDFIPTHPHRLYEGDPIRDTAYGNPLIKTLKDAQKLKPADPYKHGRFPVILKAIELAKKELDEKYPIGGVSDVPVHVGGCLMGWTQMFIAMDKDLELWNTVKDVIVKTVYEFGKAQIKVGVGGLGAISELPHKVGSEAFLNNPVWVEADHPPGIMKRLWDEFQVNTTLHACSVGPFEPGIEAWKTYLAHCHAFFMPECGGADALARAKDQLAPAMMIGNVHPVDVMLHGSPSDVEEACIDLIIKCAPGGRYVLSPGCGLPLDTPVENVQAMMNTAKKYGTYPINV